MALGVPGRLRPWIISTFGTARVVGRQPNAPAAFTPGEIPGTRLKRLSRTQGTWFCRKEPRKKSQVTPPGIDPGTVRLVAQRLNHYATLIICSTYFPRQHWFHERASVLRYTYIAGLVLNFYTFCNVSIWCNTVDVHNVFLNEDASFTHYGLSNRR